jgi:mono/diheme cytochrome c family protein
MRKLTRTLQAACVSMAVVLVTPGVLAQDAVLARGEAVYDLWCAPCHDPGPRKHPGTAALGVLYKESKPAVLLERTDLTPELVKTFVRNGVSIMPFFRKTEISDPDLDALATYMTQPKAQP